MSTGTRRYSQAGMAALHHEADVLWSRFKSSPHFPEILETLWRRVISELTPLYVDSSKVIAPDIGVALNLLLIDVLTKHVEDEAIADCSWHLEQALLRDKTISRTQRLRQLVSTMLLLTPIVPSERGIKKPSFFVEIVDALEHDEMLSWVVVSRATHDPAENPQYIPLLQIMAAGLVNDSYEQLLDKLGPQWRTPEVLSTDTILKMQSVKAMLAAKCQRCQNSILEFRADPEMLMHLWSRRQHDTASEIANTTEVENKGHIKQCPEAGDDIIRRKKAVERALDAVQGIGSVLVDLILWCITRMSDAWQRARPWMNTATAAVQASGGAPRDGIYQAGSWTAGKVEDMKHAMFEVCGEMTITIGHGKAKQNEWADAWPLFVLVLFIVVGMMW